MDALDLISPNADFKEFAQVTVEVAFQRFSRTEQEAVAAGWADVGLPVPPSATARHFAMKPPRPALRTLKPEANKWRRRPAV